jgi:o-succinylbenzoate---CoA ligase
MAHLIFPHQTYLFETISKGIYQEENEYFYEILNFCKDWLQGANHFELKTSGSTGSPKIIQVNRNQMIASAMATNKFFNIPEGKSLLCALNTNMIAGKMMLIRAMEWKCNVIVVPPMSNPFLDPITHLPIDFVALVPMQVDSIIQHADSLKRLKEIPHIIMGGSSPSQFLMDLIIKNNLRIYQTFGMTETVSHIGLAPIDSEELVYQVLPGIRIGTDVDERLWIQGEVTQHELLQTNDQVKMVGNNAFRWSGRTDFVINTGGIKVHPEQLEVEISQQVHEIFPGSDFFIFGQEDERLGQKVVLAIENTADDDLAKKLIYTLKTILPNYKVPKEIVFIHDFIRTESGKINRPLTLKSL